MDIEKKAVEILFDKNDIRTTNLCIYDNFEDDEDSVMLEIDLNEKKFIGRSDNYFDALIDLRKSLEKESIQIMCNGAAKNVYPSPMQFSMGNTRNAYKTYFGQQARMSDLVDIFNHEEDLEFVSVDEQLKFNNEWVKGFSQK